jgi:hypothetical protein
MNVNTSLSGPEAPQGFHPEGRYEFKVHFDAGAMEELTYRVSFGERDAGGTQDLRLCQLTGSESSNDAAVRCPHCIRADVGPD